METSQPQNDVAIKLSRVIWKEKCDYFFLELVSVCVPAEAWYELRFESKFCHFDDA